MRLSAAKAVDELLSFDYHKKERNMIFVANCFDEKIEKAAEERMGRQKGISNKRKKQQPDLLTDVQQLIELGLNMTVVFYLGLMIVFLPFYFTDGYAQIGSDKFSFFYKSTCGVGILFLLFWVLFVIVKVCSWKRDGTFKDIKGAGSMLLKGLSVTDRFVLGYGMVAVLSYLLSDYKAVTDIGNAFVGVNRWYMGLRTQLLLVVVYFAVSRFGVKSKWIAALWIPVTFITFVLGYLNRFGIRIFDMKNTTEEYLATIGNMNWYCGYIVIVFFGGLYYIWTMTEKKTWINVVFGVWIIMGFATLVTQGSSSGMVVLGVLLVVLYMFSVKSKERLMMFFVLLLALGFVCTITCLFRTFFPDRFNYEDILTDLLTNSLLPFGILGIASLIGLILVILQKKDKYSANVSAVTGYGICGMSILGVVIFLVLGIINTGNPGAIGPLSEMSVFTFNPEWGSYRGATWVAGLRCFAEQDIWGKLLGVGPDSMAFYLKNHASPELQTMMQEYFSYKTLTNAHCDWLTVLVNNGLLGMICYSSLFISAIARFLKAGRVSPPAGACGFAVLAYTIHNLFSFQQIMSGVTVFIVLAMGEAFVREKSLGNSEINN